MMQQNKISKRQFLLQLKCSRMTWRFGLVDDAFDAKLVQTLVDVCTFECGRSRVNAASKDRKQQKKLAKM